MPDILIVNNGGASLYAGNVLMTGRKSKSGVRVILVLFDIVSRGRGDV